MARVDGTRDVSSGEPLVETPTDAFRRRLALWVMLGVGVLFLILIGGSMVVLGFSRDDKPLTAAQAVLTTSIGFIGGMATSTLGYFFQPKERE